MKNLKQKKYILFNSLVICMTFTVVTFSVLFKTHNMKISNEISYMSNRIINQRDTLKIYKAEITLLTSPQSLRSLYMSYHNIEKFSYNNSIARVKNIESFKTRLIPQYLSLK